MSVFTFVRRSVLLLALVFSCPLLPAQHIKTVDVGKEPLAIIALGGEVHVLCSRVDANFNDTLDAGDVLPSWWVLNADDYSVLRHTELAWDAWGDNMSYAFPFRPAIIGTTDVPKLLIPQFNKVHMYDMIGLSSVGEIAMPDTIRAISIDESTGTLYCSAEANGPSPRVIAYNMQTQTPTEISASVGVQQTQPFTTSLGKKGLLILNEGAFGSPTSTLQIETFSPVSSMTLPLGNLGNSICLHGDSAFVVVNGSHTVQIVDLNSETIVRTIATGTQGLNGPREAVVYKDQLFVTTYNSDVRRFSISDGQATGLFKPGGKPEGLARVNNTLWIANAYMDGGYDPNNTIAIWNLENPVDVSVAPEQASDAVMLYPNPVKDYAALNVSLNNSERTAVQVSVVSAMGIPMGSIPSLIMGNGLHARFTPEEFHLASGAYFVQIITKNRTLTIPFTVVR